MSKVQLPEEILQFNEQIRNNPEMTAGMGPVHLLSVPGRKSGKVRATPVSLLNYEEQRWLVAGFAESDWVKNLRASGWGVLTKGTQHERIAVTEIAVEERPPVLQAFLQHVPGGRFAYDIAPDAPLEEFAAIAGNYPIFKITQTRPVASLEEAAQ